MACISSQVQHAKVSRSPRCSSLCTALPASCRHSGACCPLAAFPLQFGVLSLQRGLPSALVPLHSRLSIATHHFCLERLSVHPETSPRIRKLGRDVLCRSARSVIPGRNRSLSRSGPNTSLSSSCLVLNRFIASSRGSTSSTASVHGSGPAVSARACSIASAYARPSTGGAICAAYDLTASFGSFFSPCP